jgi:hypothetical protein
MEHNYNTPQNKIIKTNDNCTPVKRAKYNNENYETPPGKIIKPRDVCTSIKKINNNKDITHLIFPKIEFDT